MEPTTYGPFSALARRDVLRAGGAGALTALLMPGCDIFATEPADQPQRSRGNTDRRQAPMLDERVQSGDLPSRDERLPRNPMVIEPVDNPGQYGGTLTSQLDGLAAVNYKFYVELGYDSLVRWNPRWSDVSANLAESWEISNDGAEYTFFLREDVKWSDGAPFTADDLVFSYDSVFGNEELYPVTPDLFTVEGEPATLEKIDEYTIRFVFVAPSALFLQRLATPHARELLRPRHYLEQFHKEFNPDADQLAESEQYSSWADLFGAKDDGWRNTDRPTLNGWVLDTPVSDETARAVFVRNPFYWKVDTEGRQLPYIDRVTYRVLDPEVILLQTIGGDIDLNSPQPTPAAATLNNKPTLADGRETGEYRFINAVSSSMNQMIIAFNLTHRDVKMREVFQSRDFRIGMSHAINRDEIINVVFQRQGEPWQGAPREGSGFLLEELAKQYVEYDVERANEYLDRAGFTERDDSDFRLRGDGDRISFAVDVITQEPTQIQSLELIKEYWAEVGVDMQINTMDRTLFYDRKAGNQHDASVWTGGGGFVDAILDPRWYFPFSGESNYAPLWAEWYQSSGAEGEKPPEAAVEQMDLYDQLWATVDEDARNELFMQVLQIAQEQFWVLGTVLDVGAYGTVKSFVGNVPESMPVSWLYPTPGPTRPEQYYVKDSSD